MSVPVYAVNPIIASAPAASRCESSSRSRSRPSSSSPTASARGSSAGAPAASDVRAPRHAPRADRPDGIDASLDEGILTVVVPKPKDARPRRVQISTPQGNGAPQSESEVKA